jgi:putative transposase
MYTVNADQAVRKNPFDLVADSFLQEGGLPFAQVLCAGDIQQAFTQSNALFAQEDIYSTQVVLWAFLAQVLRDGKGAACASAVAQIAMYMQQTGQVVPSGDTGDYCRARAKLDPRALRQLVGQIARQLEAQAKDAWLWHGRHAKLVDGFTFTMPDTRANQKAFPQMKSQKPGVGFPIARACVVLSLATAAIHGLGVGPYEGKETGETALFREIVDCLKKGDIAVLDRLFCSFMVLAGLKLRGVDVCTRLHQCRDSDFRRGKKLGQNDHLVTWTRPQRPDWMSPETYAEIPETMTLRELRFNVAPPGCRAEMITVITTLTDPVAYPMEDIAALYGYRWNAELDIRQIKQTLGLDHLRCKTPDMVQRELWTTLLAYNLIRKVIATAAGIHDKQPRELGFTLACQTILASWMHLATGDCRDVKELWNLALKRIAANQVANRPGRVEPRVLKRRRHRYPLMTRPRQELRRKLRSS